MTSSVHVHRGNQDEVTLKCAVCRGDAKQIFHREVAYTKSMILKAPHNESAWNYLRGLCTSLGLPHKMAVEPSLSDLCSEVCFFLVPKHSCCTGLRSSDSA